MHYLKSNTNKIKVKDYVVSPSTNTIAILIVFFLPLEWGWANENKIIATTNGVCKFVSKNSKLHPVFIDF